MPRPLNRVKQTFLIVGGLLLVVALCGSLYQWLASRSDLAGTPAPGRFVDVGGHRLHIWCAGSAEPGTPAVLFDSGLGGDAFDWTKVSPEIAKFTQACMPPRAGCCRFLS